MTNRQTTPGKRPLIFSTRQWRLLMVIPLILISYVSNAQSWNFLGTHGFSAGLAAFTSIAIDPAGTPYVVYLDDANLDQASVMKYNGSNWVYVGTPGFSNAYVAFTSIAIDRSGIPYVAYQEESNGRATVMKFNGSAWIDVGNPRFSVAIAYFISMTLDSNGNPYVAFQDDASSNIGDVTVMKYNGRSWVYVGMEGFSAGGSQFTSIALNGSGTPYVAYEDYGNSNKATVMKYDGSSWVNVGSPGFSAGVAKYTSMAIDGSGTPYVVYMDSGVNNNKATVMKYDGSNWVTVGLAGFSSGPAYYTAIAIDGNGTPYIVFGSSEYYGQYPTVMKYDGSEWVNVGDGVVAKVGGVYTSIALNPEGIPYVAYCGEKAVVMTPGSWVGVKNVNSLAVLNPTIYPNPTTGSFTLQLPQNTSPATIIITNLLGTTIEIRTVPVATGNTQNVTFNLHPPTGTYIIKVTTEDNTWREKIELW
jgi:hypothetical protein